MLQQGKFMVAFFVVAISIGGICIDSAVMADQIPLLDRCELVSPTGQPSGTFVSVVRGAQGEFPVPSTEVPGEYEWRYFTTSTGSNSQIDILVPYCTNPDIGMDTVTYTVNVLPAGNPGGDVASKTFFGVWTDHENVVKLPTYNAGTGSFFIRTVGNNPIRQTSMQFKNGNNFYFCPGILGPDCPITVNPLAPVTPEQRVTIPDVPDVLDEEVTFRIIRNPRSGQITDVQVCGDAEYNLAHNCPTDPQSCCSLETRNDVFGESIHNCTNLNGNQGYQECIISGTGSPHTQNIVSGTITKVYPYCKAGETKLPYPPVVSPTLPYGFDCYVNGVIHTN